MLKYIHQVEIDEQSLDFEITKFQKMIKFIKDRLKLFDSFVVTKYHTLLMLLNSPLADLILKQEIPISVKTAANETPTDWSEIKWDFWIVFLKENDDWYMNIVLSDTVISVPNFFTSFIYKEKILILENFNIISSKFFQWTPIVPSIAKEGPSLFKNDIYAFISLESISKFRMKTAPVKINNYLTRRQIVDLRNIVGLKRYEGILCLLPYLNKNTAISLHIEPNNPIVVADQAELIHLSQWLSALNNLNTKTKLQRSRKFIREKSMHTPEDLNRLLEIESSKLSIFGEASLPNIISFKWDIVFDYTTGHYLKKFLKQFSRLSNIQVIIGGSSVEIHKLIISLLLRSRSIPQLSNIDIKWYNWEIEDKGYKKYIRSFFDKTIKIGSFSTQANLFGW